MGVQGRRALITGAGGDMGRSHALKFAEGGADVIVHDIDAESANQTAEGVRGAGARAHVIVHDIRDTKGFAAAIDEAEAALGPIDILVNNAGVSGRGLAYEDIDEETFDLLFAVHVKGTFFTSQQLMPRMRERGWGRVINISSTYGIAGAKSASHYAGAKAALLGFTKTWARELAPHGVTVNAVAPGFILTQMTRGSRPPEKLPERISVILTGRHGEPSDITRAVLFLADEDADFITAQVISPNGGEYIY